jgi:hypothetical protein
MRTTGPLRLVFVVWSISLLVGCAEVKSFSSLSFGLGASKSSDAGVTRQAARVVGAESVAVNKYLWAAAIDVLSFLPIETVDPFTGVIVFGYGTPPDGEKAYRATVHISDPALDARSLSVALQTRSGAVGAETQRAVEDAILARARQLRIGS